MTKIDLKGGFVLTELLVIIGILVILATLVNLSFSSFQKESALKNSTEEVISSLRLAQNKTLASEETSQWGVYFSTSTNQYVLFRGSEYAVRNPSFDEIKNLPGTVEIQEINTTGSEVVFSRISGTINRGVKISFGLKNNPAKTVSIFIEPSGNVTVGEEPQPQDTERIKDSRHLHLDYGRIIDTANEQIVLTFDNSIVKNIVISENLKDGQIFWEGEVDVGGKFEKIKIHTHRLNDIDTQFCLHRDRRYNTKSLKVQISGDSSGDLIFYDPDGQTQKGSSIYVGDPIWQ